MSGLYVSATTCDLESGGRLWRVEQIKQHAKKVVSDSLGLVDFTIGLVHSVLKLPTWQLKFFKEFKSHNSVQRK